MAKFKVKVDKTAFSDKPVAEAVDATLRETAVNAVEDGRKDIAANAPHRFASKWQQGLRYRIEGKEDQAKAIIFHPFGLVNVFEHGGTIQGKPLLWIPTTPGGPTARRSGKKLVSATVRGQPMLFDAGDRDRQRRPLYIGVPQVRIPKRLRIIEIIKEHVAQMGALFSKHFKE